MKLTKSISKLFVIEVKRFMKSIKAILLGAIVLSILIGTIAFCGIQMMSDNDSIVRSRIGVVSHETDSHLNYMYTFLDSFASTSTYFEFVDYASDIQAMQELESGTLTAVMVIPEGTVESIMDGTNQHIVLYFSNSNDLGTVLLNELAKAGASIMAAAQADIYAVTELYWEHGLASSVEDAWLELNLSNMRLALSRDLLYRTYSVSATQGLSLVQYYAASAIVLLLFLLGMALAAYYERPQNSLLLALQRHRISIVSIHLIRTLCVCIFYSLLLFVIAPIFIHAFAVDSQSVFIPLRMVQSILLLILLGMMYAGILQFFYAMTRNSTAAMILLFFSMLIEHVMAGGIIPYGLLPDIVQPISRFLPSYQAIHYLGSLTATGYGITTIPGFGGYCIYFIITALLTGISGVIILQFRQRRTSL